MSHLDRTRTAYDTVAGHYAVLLKDELRKSPWDRAVLAAFAEAITGPVLDARDAGRAGSPGTSPAWV
ncbi:hypothetical protein [Actinoplanes regularis]|uniref:Uncharacterized protein n=1 Tax=Actinoplanes regularis TaxID=52697 RepID=A0A239H3S6_9ACTN|nr:hypothetical protein [Actinoplanes regularis]GIE91743.1 hypothetical protein Are01nite_82230 [Actinoplanes regularis]SNS75815.1 hypothetical protein SAMN06264365_12337 [Actinoplanes regularis]